VVAEAVQVVVEQNLQALMEDPVVVEEEDVVQPVALETLLLLVLHKEEMVETLLQVVQPQP
tara:strand:- start:294 stop:476 length:183 start_codon:yes stop_codon:yes gene_type:complete